MIIVNSKPVAHMAAQIRAKQLATRDSQNKLQQIIVEYCENNLDITEAQLADSTVQGLTSQYNCSRLIDDHLEKEQLDDIGVSLSKQRKTHVQLKRAKDYAELVQEDLIGQIKKGIYYNKKTNHVADSEIASLYPASGDSFWGNSTASISSVLLASILATCKIEFPSLPGAAAFYPFAKSSYQWPEYLAARLEESSYPFASKTGMLLFGGHQYGNQSAFPKPLLFAPEGCASAVGKATYLTRDQILDINAQKIKQGGEYGYTPVTILSKDQVGNDRLNLIEPGNIFVRGDHAAIIVTKPDLGSSDTVAFMFNRTVKDGMLNMIGGGQYTYNLKTRFDDDNKEPIHILRSGLEPLHESCSLKDLLNKVDEEYMKILSKYGLCDLPGDCRTLYEGGYEATQVIGEID